ncbi:P-type conjugative transfer protein VirB9 [Pseudomonadota bacterium]
MQNVKKFLFLFLIGTIISLVSTDAFAAQTPRQTNKESKFRTYVYNPNDVYAYVGHYLYQSYIEFDEDEQIGTISMGDSTAWQIVPQQNRLFLKPIGDYPETNMTVITNNKIYHFELYARDAKGMRDKDLVYYVKFVYPTDKDGTIVQFPTKGEGDLPDLTDLSKYNFKYEFSGNEKIAPIKVFDDGTFTYFEFSNKNAEIPAIFIVDSDGYEGLVNFRATGDYVVVESVASQFTLRSGNDIVCVYNNAIYKYRE